MENKKKLLAKRPGFTLIELLVAIAILMALAGLVVLFLPRVAENISAISEANMTACDMASAVSASAAEVASQAHSLRRDVEDFLIKVRAA